MAHISSKLSLAMTTPFPSVWNPFQITQVQIFHLDFLRPLLIFLPYSDDLCRRFALLKRHMFASPFDFVFNSIDQGKPVTEVLDIPYRGSERVFIKTQGNDKVAVIFAINFVDPDDVVLGKVFMTVCTCPSNMRHPIDLVHRNLKRTLVEPPPSTLATEIHQEIFKVLRTSLTETRTLAMSL